MNTLEIKIINATVPDTRFFVDGKDAKIVKKKGSYYLVHETDAPTAEISISTHFPILGKFWIFTSIFFFIISIFGIFDKRSNPKSQAIKYEATVPVSGGISPTLRLLRWKKGEPAVRLEGLDKTETENLCYLEEKAIKRKKTMRIVNLFTLVAIVAIVVLIII